MKISELYNLQEDLKKMAAKEALKWIPSDSVIGIGSGSTVKYFIEELVKSQIPIQGVVAASIEVENQLKKYKIPLIDLNSVQELRVYVDGADQFNHLGQLIKGGGGALTREKIIAAVAEKFICIVDDSKGQYPFGHFPVALEVIPMARSFVARACVKLNGKPKYREGYSTDNENIILDVNFTVIEHPIELEMELNQIAGVVANGIFATRGADMLLIGTKEGVDSKMLKRSF